LYKVSVSVGLHRAIRFVLLLVLAGSIGLAIHRLRRTPDQEALRRYVEVLLPPLLDRERELLAQLERLGESPGLTPADARTLLVDDVNPRLIRLRKQAEALLDERSPATRPLTLKYLAALDELTDAARACVRIIDDPALPTGAGVLLVRERFAEVARRRRAFDEALEQACATHRLVRPRPAPGAAR
jgi:hypothetical protein